MTRDLLCRFSPRETKEKNKSEISALTDVVLARSSKINETVVEAFYVPIRRASEFSFKCRSNTDRPLAESLYILEPRHTLKRITR